MFREAVAGVLGVSVEEYDAAVNQAQEQVLDDALADGWPTVEQAELRQWRSDQAPGSGLRVMAEGLQGSRPGMRGVGDNLVSVAADELGMSLTELLTELRAGTSIAGVAADKGVDAQDVADAYLAQIKVTLDEAVAEGRITVC